MAVAPPRFIAFEGPEGAGKTTQARLLAERLRATGKDVLLTREPGGTDLGDRVRELILPAAGLDISAHAETLLFCAARAQLVEHALRPALHDGAIVIVDRYADSTLAYQVYGRGLDLVGVRAVLDFATGGLRADLTLLLDVPIGDGLRRKLAQSAGSASAWNQFEGENAAFHERVRQAYLQLAAAEPSRWRVINACQPIDTVAEEIWSLCSGAG